MYTYIQHTPVTAVALLCSAPPPPSIHRIVIVQSRIGAFTFIGCLSSLLNTFHLLFNIQDKLSETFHPLIKQTQASVS